MRKLTPRDCDILPDWMQVSDKKPSERTSLEQFIYDHEPAGTEACELFRDGLARLIADAKL